MFLTMRTSQSSIRSLSNNHCDSKRNPVPRGSEGSCAEASVLSESARPASHCSSRKRWTDSCEKTSL